MARYQKTLDIWKLTPEERARLQPGQHIRVTGESFPSGVYLGQKPCGTDVAAWRGNALRHPSGYKGYLRRLRDYAKA